MTPFAESLPAFSVDGRWLAYVSDESGINEVYIQLYRGAGAKSPTDRFQVVLNWLAELRARR